MKKVGIVTITQGENFGNRLQNYALQEVIESLGYDVVTIRNITRYSFISRMKGKNPVEILKKICEKIENKKYYYNRYINYNEFNNRNIKFSKDYMDIENNNDHIDQNYDYFVAGSDQIWNPFSKETSELNFLNFASNYKKISYAASFGIQKIPSEFQDNYKKMLGSFHKLSVREEAGQKIIKDLIGRDSELLVDPTLLLKKENWQKISDNSFTPKEKYLLTYFLGNITPEYELIIKEIAKKNKLQIVNLHNIRDKKYFSIGPQHFLSLMENASYVCTDSFHGTVFSLIFEHPFIVFNRCDNKAAMGSRISTLLKMTNLESRYYSRESKICDQISFDRVRNIIELERQKSFKYLQGALND